jgi:hypothetical protein
VDANQLVARVPQHPADRGIDIDVVAGAVGDDDAVGSVFEERAIAIVAVAAGFLGVLPLGDVDERGDGVRLPVQLDQHRSHQDVAGPTVAGPQHHFRVAQYQVLLEAGFERGRGFDGDHVQVRTGAAGDLVAGPPEQVRERGIDLDEGPVAPALNGDPHRTVAKHLEQPGFARRKLLGPAAQFQLRHHLPAQPREAGSLDGRQPARRPIHHAQGAEGVAVRGQQRRAGVEANPGIADDQRRTGEPRIARRVRHFHHFAPGDDVPAERDVAGGVDGRHAHSPLEPLPMLVDERDERDGHVADLGRQLGQIVERLRGQGIEHAVVAQRPQARRLIWVRKLGRHGTRPSGLAIPAFQRLTLGTAAPPWIPLEKPACVFRAGGSGFCVTSQPAAAKLMS